MIEDEEEEEDEGYNSYNSLVTEKRSGKKLERDEFTIHQSLTQEELREKFGLLKEAYDELRGEQKMLSQYHSLIVFDLCRGKVLVGLPSRGSKG